jgi:class 3 adenylate cyclase/tetratricopeptide (TPR) repeat protein
MSGQSTVTLLFTDLVDSTGMLERLGDEAGDTLRRVHFRLLSEAIAQHGGREVKRLGDGIMAVFTSAVDAVSCAVDIQRSSESGDLQVRVGVNAGEVTSEEDDYFGTAVHVAARLCQAADGGQVLASGLVRGLVGNRGNHRFRDVGSLHLKGLAEPVASWSVAWRDEEETPPTHMPTRAPLPRALSMAPPVAFVGRDPDLARVLDAWGAVVKGARRVALVAGEPGIGKTRLCTEVAQLVHADGAIVLYGHADEESVVPFQPFAEAVGDLLGTLDAEGHRALTHGLDLERIVPSRSPLPDHHDALASVDAETDRYRLFESVTSLLSRAAADSPVLLVLDDLHWADKPSLLLLRHIARSTTIQRLLVLGTYRDTDLDRRHPLSEALGDLRRDAGYKRVLLRGLSADEVTLLMETTAGHAFHGRGLDVPAQIHRETDGNPYFIAEVIRHMVEVGTFFQRDGVWVYDASAMSDQGIPEGIRDVLGRRLSRLSDNANQVLARACVLGREFEYDVLDVMAGSEHDVLAGIEESVERGLLIEIRAGRAARYAFADALLRQALYDELSLPRMQKLHLRAAQAIEKVHERDLPSHVAALALHFRAAGAAADPGRAIDFSIRAGHAAHAASAYEEAVTHFEAAVQLIDEEGAVQAELGPVLEQLGDLMHITGIDRQRGISCLERALTLSRGQRAVWIQSRLGRAYSTHPGTMNIHRALEHFRAAEHLVEGLPPSVQRGYLAVGVASAHLWGDDAAAGQQAAGEAMAIAERLDNEVLWSNAAAVKGWFLCGTGHFDEGRALLDRAWEVADRIGHVMGAYFATLQLVSLGFYGSDLRAGVAVYEREAARGRLPLIPHWRDMLLAYHLDQLTACGSDEQARAFIADHPDSRHQHAGLASIGPMLRDGEWEEAERCLAHDVVSWRERGVFLVERTYLVWLSLCRDLLGDTAGSAAALDRILDGDPTPPSQQTGTLALVRRASVDLDLGDVGAAVERLRTLRALAGVDSWSGLGAVLYGLDAEIALASGDRDSAAALRAVSLELSGQYPWAIFDSERDLRWGLALLRKGDRNGADEAFERALAVYPRLGFGSRWAARVEAMRR